METEKERTERERGGGEGEREGETDRQTDRQAGRQAGRQTGRQAGRQTDRQTETNRDRGKRRFLETHLKSSCAYTIVLPFHDYGVRERQRKETHRGKEIKFFKVCQD